MFNLEIIMKIIFPPEIRTAFKLLDKNTFKLLDKNKDGGLQFKEFTKLGIPGKN